MSSETTPLPQEASRNPADTKSQPRPRGKRSKEPRFALQQTQIPGVAVRVEPGTPQPVAISKAEIRRLTKLGRRLKNIRIKMDQLAEDEKDRRLEIIEISEDRGVNGVISVPDNTRLGVWPSRSIEHDIPMLEERTGNLFPFIAKQEAHFRVAIPPGAKTKEGKPIGGAEVLHVLTQAMLGIGFDENVVHGHVNVIVDEKALRRFEREKGEDLSKARRITKTWNVRATPLNPEPDKKAGKRARNPKPARPKDKGIRTRVGVLKRND